MKVKKILFILGVSFFLGGLFSCSTGMGQDVTEEEKKEEEKTESGSIKGVSFNISDLTSLAIADETTATRSAARSTVSEGMLVKLLEDGTVENFINVPKDGTLAPVSFVTQSPAQNSKEIYIVFESSSGWYELVERTDEWGNTWTEWGNYVTLGRLLCVYEDGSYVDVLATEDGSWKDLCNNGNQDSPIKFDGQGNMYYQVWESAGNSSTSMIYKFDPKKKESKQLTPQVPNVSYEQFYVSADGNWIFAKANRWNSSGSSANYLRAIPVSDVNNPVNLFYDSTGSSWLDEWIYDEISKNVYYLKDWNIYKIPYKNGTYAKENQEIILGDGNYNSNNVSFYWDTFLEQGETLIEQESVANFKGRAESFELETGDFKYYYFIDPSDGVTINYDQVVKYLFAELTRMLKWEYKYSNEYDEYGNYISQKLIDYSTDYEIRFDVFADIEGFESLATETKDEYGNSLTNEDLFKALVEKNLLWKLYQLLDSERYTQNIYGSYKNTFLADIFYNIETGEKISDNFFEKDDLGYFTSYFYSWNFIEVSSWGGEYSDWQYIWKSDFLNEDGSVNAEKVLEKFAECCGKDSIDFSLACFKDSETWSDLYTTEKNEDAIKFLDTKEKRETFVNVICSYGWEFLTKTCFIPETDTPAYGSDVVNSGVNYGSLDNFTLVGQTLYATDYNGRLVLLIDDTGNPVGKYVDLGSEVLKISSTLVYNGDFYFQNAILDAAGDEVGAHKILRFDTKTSVVEDMFYNMPNNTTFEVVSYTVGGQNLYCCLTKGTEIQTVKIDVTTKQYTQLASGTKLKQIIIIK